MNQNNVIKQVAEMARIADSYVSAWGEEAKVETDTIVRLLTSLGYDTSSDEALLASAKKKHKPEVLASVTVIQDGAPAEVSMFLGPMPEKVNLAGNCKRNRGRY